MVLQRKSYWYNFCYLEHTTTSNKNDGMFVSDKNKEAHYFIYQLLWFAGLHADYDKD